MATSIASSETWERSLLQRAPGLGLALLVALYVVLMPSFNLLPYAPYNTKRLLEVIMLLGAGVWLPASGRVRTAWLQSFYTLPVLARAGLLSMVGIGCMAAAWAPLPRYAFLEVSHLVLLFILTVALVSFYRHAPEKAEQFFLLTIVLGVLLYVTRFYIDYVFSLTGMQYAFRGKPGAIWPNGELQSFVHIRHFNQLQTWTLPLVVLPALLFAKRGSFVRWTYSGLAMTWWMLLFASGGRGTMLALMSAFLVVLLTFRKQALPWLRVQGVALAGGVLFYGLFFKVFASTGASVLERNLTQDSYRFQLWESAWDLIQAHPLLGAGPMHYARYASEWAAHPHNAVLQWASEWGVPAALLGVGLVAWGLVSCLRRFGRQAKPPAQASPRIHVRVAVIASLLAATVHALVSGIVVMPMSQIMLALVVGWCWGMYASDVPGQRKRMPRYRNVVLALLAVASVAVTGWATVQEAFVQKEREAAYYQTGYSSGLRPRFWFQGYLAPDGSNPRSHKALQLQKTRSTYPVSDSP